MNIKNLALILKESSSFPSSKRVTAWQYALALPCNSPRYENWVARGPFPSVPALEKISSQGVVSGEATRCFHALCHWCPALADQTWAAGLVAAIDALIPGNPLILFETSVTLLTNHCWSWLASYPAPPAAWLAAVEALTVSHLPTAAERFTEKQIPPQLYIWPLFDSGLRAYLTLPELGALLDHVVVYSPPFLAAFAAAFAAVHSRETAAYGVLSTACNPGFFPALRLARRVYAAESRGCYLPTYHKGDRTRTHSPFATVPLPRGGSSGWVLVPLPDGPSLPPPPATPAGAELPYMARQIVAMSAAATAAREAQMAAARQSLVALNEARARTELAARAEHDEAERWRREMELVMRDASSNIAVNGAALATQPAPSPQKAPERASVHVQTESGPNQGVKRAAQTSPPTPAAHSVQTSPQQRDEQLSPATPQPQPPENIASIVRRVFSPTEYTYTYVESTTSTDSSTTSSSSILQPPLLSESQAPAAGKANVDMLAAYDPPEPERAALPQFPRRFGAMAELQKQMQEAQGDGTLWSSTDLTTSRPSGSYHDAPLSP